MIDTSRMLVFIEVARSSSVREASKTLGMTPSGVSHSLRKLEEELGHPLFVRSGPRIVLSDAGRSFLADANGILEYMRSAKARLDEGAGRRPESLTVSATPLACDLLLPSVLRELTESFADIQVQLLPGDDAQSKEWLSEGRVQAALLHSRPVDRSIDADCVLEEALQLCVSASHPWAAKRRPVYDDFDDARWILPPHGDVLRDRALEYFRSIGRGGKHVLETAGERSILELVRLDLGVAILPRWLAGADQLAGAVCGISLGHTPPARPWWIASARAARAPLPQQVFIELCRAKLKEAILQ